MARSRELRVVIAGDADKLERELKKSNTALDKLGKQTRLTGTLSSKGYSAMRVGATGAAAALGGLALAGKKVVDAAIESEKSQARLATQLKASGLSYQAHAKDIDRVIQKHSQLAGVDDEDLQDAFTAIVRTTGSVSTAMKSMGLVTDLARSKNMDVAKAGDAVAKVHAGQYRALKTLNLEFVKTTDNVDKLKASDDKITPAELAAAKAADVRANSMRALGMVQDKVRGQAEAYGKTTAGAMDRADVAFENLQETVGAKLAPSVEKAANKLSKFVNEMSNGTGQGGRFVDKLKDIWSEVRPVVTWIGRATKNVKDFVAEHPNVGKLAAAVLGVGVAVKTLKFVSAATGFTDLLKGGRAVMRKLVAHFAKQGAVAGAAAGAGAAGGEGLTSAATFNRMRSGSNRLGKVMGRGLVVGIIAGFALAIPDFVKWVEKTPLFSPKRLGESIGKRLGNVLGTDAGDVAKGRYSQLAAAQGGGAAGAIGGDTGGLSSAARSGLSQIQRLFGGVRVSSGYRTPEENRRVGGATNSDHLTGNALDLVPSGGWSAKGTALLDRVAAWARKNPAIRWIGWRGVPGHGPGDHLHLSFRPRGPQGAIGDVVDKLRAYGGKIRGKGDVVGGKTVAEYARRAGFKGSALVTALAIARGESGWNTTASNRNSDGSIDRGLWQINSVHGSLSTFDPAANARAAWKISKGGRKWSDWVVYNKGLHKQHIAAARAAAIGSRGSGSGGSAPKVDRAEQRERAGSRIINALTAKYSPGIDRALKAAGRTGTLMETASTAYGQLERRFGQSEEDLGTADGRAKRTDELMALKDEKGKQLARAQRRAAHLKTGLARLDKLIKDARKKRDKAKGQARARIVQRIRDFEDKRTDLAAELRAILSETIPDLQLDIGDLDKDLAEVAATENTGAAEAREAAAEAARPENRVSSALSDIDLQERAGILTAEAANEWRQSVLRGALAGEFGSLDQRQQWELMGQLRDAQQAATDAQKAATEAADAQTQALRDLKASIDQSNAIANSTLSISAREATRAFADVISGQLGQNAGMRGTMPGTGRLASVGNSRY